MSHKAYYTVSDSRWLRPVLASPVGALAVHWTFQCITYMDATERRFKLGFELLLFLVCLGILALALPFGVAAVLGLLLAHTLNLVLNGHTWVVMKHFGRCQHSRSDFDQEMQGLVDRINCEPCIVFAAGYGSLARGRWSPTSDLDVRLVRAPGWRSALRVCWFALRERSRAFWHRFPLDIYVLDSYASLDVLAEKDSPVIFSRRVPDEVSNEPTNDTA